VVLGLEAEVALAHDDDLGELEHGDLADAVDVAADERELLAGLCLCVFVRASQNAHNSTSNAREST
jgi:hypothetical protein